MVFFFLRMKSSVNTFLPVPLGVTYLLKFLSVPYFFGNQFFSIKSYNLFVAWSVEEDYFLLGLLNA